MNENYPSLDNENFNLIISEHPDFKNFKSILDDYTIEEIIKLTEEKCNSTGGYIYKNIQLFVSSFLSINTPYNGLLLYHGVGVGKTCSSLLISENFKDYVKEHKKKIIILTKPAIQENYMNEIFNYKTYINNIDQNVLNCISNEYKEDWNEWKEKYESDKYETFRNMIINEYYEIYGYQEFTNKYKNIKKDGIYDKIKINNLFSDTIIIIDEVHNLRDEDNDLENEKEKLNVKESKEFLNAIVENLDNPIKLILLSATPMYDKYEEIEFLINLLRKNDNKSLMNINLLHNIINEKEEDKLEIFKQEFYKYVRGYISYIKGNDPFIFPTILYPNNVINIYFEGDKTYMPIIKCIMSSYQKKIYNNIDKKLNYEKSKYTNLVLPEKSKDIYFNFNELFKYNSKLDKYNIINNDIVIELLDNIKKYSCKLYNLKKNLLKPIISKGKIFIYSSFIDEKYGGGKFISILLEKLGFQRKIVKKKNIEIENCLDEQICKKYNNLYYIRLDGETSVNHRNIYLNEFNNNNNNDGSSIKIIIGSTNLFEGVSFLNLREIHILEPWYNKSRYEQIIGREYRQCSHKMLPFNERNLTIYNYIALSTDITSLINNNNYSIKNIIMNDIDLRKIQLANKKMDNIEKINELIEYSSIDCILNKNVNNINKEIVDKIEDINIINQTNSKNIEYLIKLNKNLNKCLNEEEENIFDYNNINISLNSKFINNIKYFIKIAFIKSTLNYFTIEYLYEKTLELYNNFDLNIFKYALQELILTKEKLFNKFNQEGYLTINGSYIIFKPFNIKDINIPIEFIQYPFKTKLKNIDFYEPFTLNIIPKIKKKQVISEEDTKTPNTIYHTNKLSILDMILEDCKNNTILDGLSTKTIFNKYETIWRNLEPTQRSGRHHPNFNKDIKYEIIIKKSSELLNNMLLDNLFKITDNITLNIPNDIILKYYNINLNCMFIFNFQPIILTYLKCIFYKKYISNKELSDLETDIFNNYKNLVINTEPLIFKFIDFSKNNINVYDYVYLQNIYYEYDITISEWILHQYDINKIRFLTKKNINDKSYNFYKINAETDSPLCKKDFITSELNITSDEFNNIYNSFDFNIYSSYNDGYFYYSGDPSNPFERNINNINRYTKFSNIIGYVNISLTDTDTKLKSSMSRIILSLGILFSRNIENKNIYFKGSHNSGGFNNHLPSTNVTIHIYHIIYCIIDHIIELNSKIILNIILENTKININDLWNINNNDSIPYKYILKDFYDYDFNTNTYNFSEEQFNNLNNFLNINFKISIKNDYSYISELLIKKKHMLYNYTYITNILIYFNNNHTKLNNSYKEHYYSKLLIILLYDLNSINFGNKRWLLNFYESVLLNPSVLNLTIKPKTRYNECKNNRCGDTTSIPNKSTFSLRLQMKKSAEKYINLDT